MVFIIYQQFAYYFYCFFCDSIRYLFGRRERRVLFFNATLPILSILLSEQKKTTTTKQTDKQQAKKQTNRKKHITMKEATTLKGDF